MPDFVVIGGPGYDSVFQSHDGIVGSDLDRRADRVLNAAKAKVGVKTGRLKRDLHKRWMPSGTGRLVMQVGSSVSYATVHHDGAKPHIIRARDAKAMRWVNDSGNVVFATTVHHPGHRANRYLETALPQAIR